MKANKVVIKEMVHGLIIYTSKSDEEWHPYFWYNVDKTYKGQIMIGHDILIWKSLVEMFNTVEFWQPQLPVIYRKNEQQFLWQWSQFVHLIKDRIFF